MSGDDWGTTERWDGRVDQAVSTTVRGRSDGGSDPIVLVLLEDGLLALAEDAIPRANLLLAPTGLSLAGPWPMDATLPPLPDDLGLTLIRALASLRAARRVVALTARPLEDARGFTIGGEAQLAGRIGVVSTCGPRDPDLLAARLAHEVGHLGGLRHCGAPGCLMVPHVLPAGQGEASPTFCEGCLEQLLTPPQTPATG